MWVIHRSAAFTAPSAPRGPGLFTTDELAERRAYFADHAELVATPLRSASALAAACGVGRLWLKDETDRFGLPAFKGLGAGYAVARLVAEGRIAKGATLVCASEGNHGRAVARAARVHGLACRVYVAAAVAEARAAAIAAEGAEIVRVAGTYDDAVRRAAADAEREGWQVVSDTAWPGYEEIPRLIMLGYTQLMDECAAAWGDAAPDLVLVQAGVGGLAAAVGSWYAVRPAREQRPRLLCVEPLSAACLLESARAGRPVTIAGNLDTVMGGLRCGEVSLSAFPAVRDTFDAYVAIDDEWAREAMRRLARPAGDDPRIACGPSGAAGVAALLALQADPALTPVREALGISRASTVMAIVTEGVTEPELFAEVVRA